MEARPSLNWKCDMRKVFLTFGDGSENFVSARERLMYEAELTGQFDEIRGLGWSDVKTHDVLVSSLRRCKRGCGYWLWKPAIISETLAELDDGDVLVYCDSGDELSKSSWQWKKFFRCLDDVDIICKRISACALHRSRKELLARFGCGAISGCRLCFQYEMGAAFIRKTPFVVELIDEWLQMMLAHPDLVADVQSKDESEQMPTFMENRHDQSVFSLILAKCLCRPDKRRKIKTVWEFHRGWWLFGEPCISTPRNRSGNRMRVPIKARLKRIVYRVLWRAQLLLERHGICLFWEKGGWYGA